ASSKRPARFGRRGPRRDPNLAGRLEDAGGPDGEIAAGRRGLSSVRGTHDRVRDGAWSARHDDATERRRAELARTDGVVPTGSRRPAFGQSDDATDAPRATDAGARFPQRVVRAGAHRGFARGRGPRGGLPGALLSWDGLQPHHALF